MENNLESVGSRLEELVTLFLNGISHAVTRAMYRKAINDFLEWWDRNGRAPLSIITVQAHRDFLCARGYSASTINQRLSAIRKLFSAAGDRAIVGMDQAVGIARIRGIRQAPNRTGKSLTVEQAERLMNAPNPGTGKGKRDRALLSVLLGCALTRSEVVRLQPGSLRKIEGRWVVLDIEGKHGRKRRVPIPPWVKTAIDNWVKSSELAEYLFPALDRQGESTGKRLSAASVFDIVKHYGDEIGLDVRPRDLRRTCARLCRSGGADLEQIQLLLGHSSIQITEQYMESRKPAAQSANDHLGLRWRRARRLAS